MTTCLVIGLIVLVLNWKSLYSHNKFIQSKGAAFDNTIYDKNKIIELIKHAQITETAKINDRANVKIFDLSKELEPVNIYSDIKCRKSAKFIVETTLCIHPVDKDIWVSSSIWNNGVWEGDIVCKSLLLFT